MQVCYGEFDWPDGNAQRANLDKVLEFAPSAWNNLFDGPFTVYRELKPDNHLTWAEITQKPDLNPQQLTLVHSLRDWATAWHLNAPWCLERAFSTLRLLLLFEDRPIPGVWDSEMYGGIIPTPLPPPDGLPAYEALIITRQTYLDGVRSKTQQV